MAKYRVTMSTATEASGVTTYAQAVDYVPESMIDAYVRDARTRWVSVVVGSDPDDGPGGPGGAPETPAEKE